METTKTYLTLKWGTLKSWDFSNSDRAKELLKEYFKIGSSFSAMMQQDTRRLQEIICELIDLCDGVAIHLDWDEADVSKQEAKDYVVNYEKKTT